MNTADAQRRELILTLSAQARAGHLRTAEDRLASAGIGMMRHLAVISGLGMAAMLGMAWSVRLEWYALLAVGGLVCGRRLVQLIGVYRTAFIQAQVARGMSELDAIKLYNQTALDG